MRTVFILMDSLNRHLLNAYGESWVKTPNLDRLAERGLVFDNHFCGSMPCMPARRELMTGRYNFMETPWGPIEPWDTCLPTELDRQKGTYSHMITDHYHYFHRGGYGYHNLFNSWELERGQEGDVWRPAVELPECAADRGKALARGAYWRNRKLMDTEDDLSYSTPRCFQRAVEFCELNHATDNWHLHLEVFDPHEPFDCPDKYRDLYDDTWNRRFFTWPPYAPLDSEHDDEETVAHIRKCYAGVLTMADIWLGKLLDKMDELDMWKDTIVILSTDHGHLLGDHGYWAKNYMFDYTELSHIPLYLCAPGVEGGQRRSGLTSTIDLMPTIMELHGATPPSAVHGKSFAGLIKDDCSHNDVVLYGYFGKDINMTDGTLTYCRQSLPDTDVYLHTATPGDIGGLDPEVLASDETEVGDFLPAARGMPLYRVRRETHRHHNAPKFNPIYDLSKDPLQKTPIIDAALETTLAAKLHEAMQRYEAPESEFARVGLLQPQSKTLK